MALGPLGKPLPMNARCPLSLETAARFRLLVANADREKLAVGRPLWTDILPVEESHHLRRRRFDCPLVCGFRLTPFSSRMAAIRGQPRVLRPIAVAGGHVIFHFSVSDHQGGCRLHSNARSEAGCDRAAEDSAASDELPRDSVASTPPEDAQSGTRPGSTSPGKATDAVAKQ